MSERGLEVGALQAKKRFYNESQAAKHHHGFMLVA
jgi:hypothetical protein